jgi:hypothetical protein
MGFAPRTNGLAVASLVLSLAGLVTCGIGSILGIIFGFIARGQIRRTGESGDGMALAGIIIGFALVALVVVGVVLAAVGSSGSSTY